MHRSRLIKYPQKITSKPRNMLLYLCFIKAPFCFVFSGNQKNIFLLHSIFAALNLGAV